MTSNSSGPKHANKFDGETDLETRVAASFARFNAKHSSEKDCFEEICRRASIDRILKCHHCQSTDMHKVHGERISRCRTCKKPTWAIANTFFHRIRCARAWLAAIWLMEEGLTISSFKFHKLIGIAYSSALNIFRKLTTVIHNQMDEDAIAVRSSLFSSVIGKRSSETPARQSPASEQEVIDQQALDPSASTDTTTTLDTAIDETPNTQEFSEVHKQVYNFLSEEPTHYDLLCQQTGLPVAELSAALAMLEIEGLVSRRGGMYSVRLTPPRLPSAIETAGSTNSITLAINAKPLIKFVCSRFHRISRKYLQNYIAAYWCHKDRSHWSPGVLMEACLRFGSISYREILDYVTPAMVKVVPDT